MAERFSEEQLRQNLRHGLRTRPQITLRLIEEVLTEANFVSYRLHRRNRHYLGRVEGGRIARTPVGIRGGFVRGLEEGEEQQPQQQPQQQLHQQQQLQQQQLQLQQQQQQQRQQDIIHLRFDPLNPVYIRTIINRFNLVNQELPALESLEDNNVIDMVNAIATNLNSISSSREKLTVETTIQCMFYSVIRTQLSDLLWAEDDIDIFMGARGFNFNYSKHSRIAARGRRALFLLHEYGSLPLYCTEIIKASMYNTNIDRSLEFFNQTRLFDRMHDQDQQLGVAADNAEMGLNEAVEDIIRALDQLSLDRRDRLNWRG